MSDGTWRAHLRNFGTIPTDQTPGWLGGFARLKGLTQKFLDKPNGSDSRMTWWICSTEGLASEIRDKPNGSDSGMTWWICSTEGLNSEISGEPYSSSLFFNARCTMVKRVHHSSVPNPKKDKKASAELTTLCVSLDLHGIKGVQPPKSNPTCYHPACIQEPYSSMHSGQW